MLANVADGLGDIAAANLTDTPEREKVVDMIAPKDQRPVSEVVVTGPKAAPVPTLDDLSGKTIHVRKVSSYYESVVALNKRLVAEGKAPVKIVELPDALEDEDELEMLNAGLLDYIVVDDWKAHLWSKILPKVKVRDDLVMRSGGIIGWAIRKDSPKLYAAGMDFYTNFIKKQSGGAHIEFERRIQQIRPNTASDEVKRFDATIHLFQKYGGQYSFDPLMLAAQGYQESALNQEAKSQVGAIGVMQLMPATGTELGVGDIHQVEPNIHGGAKYMDQLLTRYFGDAKFSDADRPLFAFAAYNAGPGNIAKMRRIAAERGLDPDKWFNNVEVIVSEKIGIETTTYVRNIYKYYVAYKLTQEAQETARKAREQVAPAKAG
jgi:membrane-bound lytic murein transglycosylase MltF